MFNVLVVAVATGLLMSVLVGGMLLWTAAVKLMHPKWSWRRCAKYTTLIQ